MFVRHIEQYLEGIKHTINISYYCLMLKYGFCCGLLGVSEYIAPSSFLVYIFDLSKY